MIDYRFRNKKRKLPGTVILKMLDKIMKEADLENSLHLETRSMNLQTALEPQSLDPQNTSPPV